MLLLIRRKHADLGWTQVPCLSNFRFACHVIDSMFLLLASVGIQKIKSVCIGTRDHMAMKIPASDD
jgi:hypothetical protein